MTTSVLPVAVLAISAVASGRDVSQSTEPVYGGYANGRGEVVLFGKDLAYRVNFKKQTLQERPQLNPGAQARYDATDAGEEFRVRPQDVPTPEQRTDRRDLFVGPVQAYIEILRNILTSRASRRKAPI